MIPHSIDRPSPPLKSTRKQNAQGDDDYVDTKIVKMDASPKEVLVKGYSGLLDELLHDSWRFSISTTSTDHMYTYV